MGARGYGTGMARTVVGRSARGRGRALLATLVLVVAAVGAWWSGVLPCALVVAQPACQLVVTGGPVLDTDALLDVAPVEGAAEGGGAVPVRDPVGRLLVTTIEVSEPDDVGEWWAAVRDPALDLVARSRLVPDGGDLTDVARVARDRMEESRVRAAALALDALDLIDGPDVAAADWPFAVTLRTDEVGGPSAGLMLALGVIAQLAPEDPTVRTGAAASARPPLVVAGTGALEEDGRVANVGGVDHKLRSVVADARGGPLPDAFLLPVGDLPVARRTIVERDLLLVPVTDVADAVEALAVLAGGGTPGDAELLAAGVAGGR